MEEFVMEFLEKFGFPVAVAGYFMLYNWKQGTKINETLQDIAKINAGVLVYLAKNGVHCRNRQISDEEIANIENNPVVKRLIETPGQLHR